MRKQLAIKGHEYRGDEVIEILKMLGASNKKDYTGSYPTTLYILNDNNIDLAYTCDCEKQEIFKLEDFLRKYPFKIGDKVINDNYSGYGIITEMVWDSVDWSVKYCVKFEDFGTIAWFKYNEIKTSDICLIDKTDICLISKADPLHELCESKTSTLIIDSEVCKDEVELILNDYEIEIRDGKTYAVKKKPKYPKTYEECCKTLGIQPDNIIITNCYGVYGTKYENNLIDKFGALWELIICRDAYRKIYSEQMGLEKPWEPNYISLVNNEYFTIHTFNNEIAKSGTSHRNAILSFPTEELRDIFFENFKDLIEHCKNLL